MTGNLYEESRELAARLEEATEQLNDAFGEAEEAIRSCRLGVSASVPISDKLRLAFEKTDLGWCLVVINAQGDRKSITSSARATRILAAPQLEALMRALMARADADANAVAQAVAEVSAWAEKTRVDDPEEST